MAVARESAESDLAPQAGAAGHAATVSSPVAGLLLRLQASAGNAAVGRLLARQPVATLAPAVPAWHKGLAAALPADPQGEYDRLHKACEAAGRKQAADAAALKGDRAFHRCRGAGGGAAGRRPRGPRADRRPRPRRDRALGGRPRCPAVAPGAAPARPRTRRRARRGGCGRRAAGRP